MYKKKGFVFGKATECPVFYKKKLPYENVKMLAEDPFVYLYVEDSRTEVKEIET